MESASLFALPVLDAWLVHAPLHSVTALVNASAVRKLATLRHEELPDALGGLATELARPPRPEPEPSKGLARPEFVGLVTTRACNLRCAYCAFGATSDEPASMPLPMAVGAVDWMAEQAHAASRATLDVHFFGGEAFCAPDVIDVAVHRARARAAELGLKPRFEVATNGCFDEERCRFVADYFDSVVLSIDGPQDLQDTHRPFRSGSGSYASVANTVRALARSRVELSLRVTVTSASLERLPEITRGLCGEFQPTSIALEPLRPTRESDEAGLAPPDPWAFAAACLEAFRAARVLGVQPIYAAASIDEVRHSFCPVGRDSIIISPGGRIGACYMAESDWRARGIDLTLGHITASGAVSISPAALDRVRALTRHGERCRRCLARWHCAGGCHVSQSATDRLRLDNPFCIATRLITVCELLEHLGHAAEATRLLRDRSALVDLALRPSDCLGEWEASHDRPAARR